MVRSAGEQELTAGRSATSGAVCDAQPLVILLPVQTSRRSRSCRRRRRVRRTFSNETRLTVERASAGLLLLRGGARPLPGDADDAEDSRLWSGRDDGGEVGGADGGLDADLALEGGAVARHAVVGHALVMFNLKVTKI